MEVLIGLSLLLAGIVGGAGLIVFYRRRRAERSRLRSEELRALDQRIASRIAGLREGGNAAAAPPPRTDDELADLATPLPALLPLESGTSLLSRLGLRRPSRDVDPAERSTGLRDTAVVLGVGVVLLVIASQFLPASTPPPNATATPTGTLVAQLPTGTPNLLHPTPISTATPAETPTPTADITFEPTPTPVPTAAPTPYQPPGGGGGGGGGGPTPTPNPTAKPDTTPPTRPGGFGINTLTPTSVTLDWTASSDNVGVKGYQLWRDSTLLGTTTSLAYTTPVTPGMSYTFKCRAYDAALNYSTYALQPVAAPASSYTVTATAGAGGSVSPSGAVSVNWGASQGFTITPDLNYHVASVTVDGSSVGAVTSYTFTNVTADHTISASFAIDTYTITASVASGTGSISPSGAVSVNAGADQTFTIDPGAGTVVDVLVDGSSVGPVTSYTFTNVVANHTIAASFSP